jgi:hypothetical protein
MGELEKFEVKDIAEDDEKLKEVFEKKVSNSCDSNAWRS